MSDEISRAWGRIAAWVGENRPADQFYIGGSAKPAELEDAERQLGRELPADLKALLRLTNGSAQLHCLLDFTPVEDLAEESRNAQRWVASMYEVQTAGPVHAKGWSAGWFPFVFMNGTSAYHCIDMDPPSRGIMGQVIYVNMRTWERRVLAPSLAVYLDRLATALEDGTLVWSDDLRLRRATEDTPEFWATGEYVHHALSTHDIGPGPLLRASAPDIALDDVFAIAVETAKASDWSAAVQVFEVAERRWHSQPTFGAVSRSLWYAFAQWNFGQREAALAMLPEPKDKAQQRAIVAFLAGSIADWSFRRAALAKLSLGYGPRWTSDILSQWADGAQWEMHIQAEWHAGDRDRARELMRSCVDLVMGPPVSGGIHETLTLDGVRALLHMMADDFPDVAELRGKLDAVPQPAEPGDEDYF
jgi:cell wall assembly regulator SMI1